MIKVAMDLEGTYHQLANLRNEVPVFSLEGPSVTHMKLAALKAAVGFISLGVLENILVEFLCASLLIPVLRGLCQNFFQTTGTRQRDP